MRARGGSKTFDSIKVLLWFAFLGFAAAHIVPTLRQITQPKLYLNRLIKNSFLFYAVKQPLHQNLQKTSVTFRNDGTYELLNLTEAIRSRRFDIMLFDEVRDMNQQLIDDSLPCLETSNLRLERYISTPSKGSAFEFIVNQLRKEHKPVLIRTWEQIGFLDHNKIAKQKATKPIWWFLQEYDCTFAARAGAVFPNTIHGEFATPLDLPINFGLDWNPSAGHWIVGTRWDKPKNNLYIIMERNLGIDLENVLKIIFVLLTENPDSQCAIEDGGTNEGFCDALFMYIDNMIRNTDLRANKEKLKYLRARIYRHPWDSAGKNKSLIISALMSKVIYCDERITPQVDYWLSAAHWSEDSEEPKLEKDKDQHPLDAGLHSADAGLNNMSLEYKGYSDVIHAKSI